MNSGNKSETGKSETKKEGKPIQVCVNELVTAVGYKGSILSMTLLRDVQNIPQNM